MQRQYWADEPPPVAQHQRAQSGEPEQLPPAIPVLIITHRESSIPQDGESAFLSPEVAKDEKELRRLKRAIGGKLHGRNRRTGHIGHCEVHYVLSPQAND